MNIVFTFLANAIDFWILDRYLKCFENKRRFSKQIVLLIFAGCVFITGVINQFNNPNLNLIFSLLLIFSYGLTYKYSVTYHIVLPIIYIGFGFVAELISYFMLTSYLDFLPVNFRYPVTVLICELVRYLIVCMIRQMKNMKLTKMPISVVALLIIIPILSVVICCIAMNIIKNDASIIVKRLCSTLIIVMFVSNILIYEIFQKFVNAITENHNKELLLQEAKLKEEFYHQVEESNTKIRIIKHNMKNQLLALCAQASNKDEFTEQIEEIIGDLDESDKKIYTSNVIFNTVLNNKISYAESQGIKVEASILVPKSINMDYSDVGILIGNLFDNAIEACEKVRKEDRWINIKITYKNGIIILKICNSKEEKEVTVTKSSKKDFQNHGMGIPSIKRIVDKYNGTINFVDKNDEFEVNASLYGIENIQ